MFQFLSVDHIKIIKWVYVYLNNLKSTWHFYKKISDFDVVNACKISLFFKVVDTNDVNEDEEDESGPLLMTNVIDMSMSDGQQPKEEIVMKLPIHKKGNEVEEMCVLATSEEDPDDVDDWEV